MEMQKDSNCKIKQEYRNIFKKVQDLAVLKYGSPLFKNVHFLDEAGHVEKHVGT